MKINFLKCIFTVFAFVSMNFIFGQERQITGVVVDSFGGVPIPGANVIIEGTTSGVSTDFDGGFVIEVALGQTLSISSVGYTTKKIRITGTLELPLQVKLEEDITSLEQVVVVGYGSQRKNDFTGSIASVSLDRIEDKPNTNFTQALQGALPGVVINQNTSSAEQNDISIRVRGRNSINASNGPLIVLDGIPYAGGVSEINPNDIKSLTVLKDASSTAIYGSRGANGVILIETKKGAKGKPTINFTTYTGINEIANLLDVHSGQGYAAFKETREPGNLSQSEIDMLINGESTDWLDLATRTGIRKDYNLSVSGGTPAIDYYISLGHQDVEGVSINDKFIRTALRTNFKINISDNLRFGSSTQISRIDRSGDDPNFGGDSGAYFMNPLTRPYDENGDLTIFPWPEDPFFTNPLGATLAVNDDISYRIFSANYLEYDFPFLEGLSLRLNTGVEYETGTEYTYRGRNMAAGFRVNGEANIDNDEEKNFLLENILNYNKTFGKHTIGFTGLYSAQKRILQGFETEGIGFLSDFLTYNQIDLALALESSNRFQQETLVSQMGRLNYNYDSRYYLTLTARRDGYSGFGDDTKYGVFPSVALAWNVSNESFFNNEGWLNFVKLRLTYGENGNQDIGRYDNLARLSDRSYLNGSSTAAGYIPSQLANNVLSWETTASFNIGADLRLFDNKIQLTLDAYKANTTDLLLDRRIPAIHGLTEITQNIGETQNQGFEIGISGKLIENDNFSWGIAGNYSYNKNEIVSLFGGKQDDIGNKLFIGQPIASNYDLQFDGIWQEGDDILNSAQQDAVPGDVRVLDVANTAEDVDGNTIISISQEDDRVLQGQRDPKSIFGLTNTFTYKNLALSVFVHGVTGVTKENTRYNENVFGGVRRNWFVNQYWTPENPINTFHRNAPNANIFGVPFYESADFIRVKDITLSYTMGKEVFGDSGTSIKLYATGINLFTFTDWTGLDPELSSQRAVPLQKQYILGLNVKF